MKNQSRNNHITHDGFEQELAEEAPRESEEMFRLLFEMSNDAIFISHPDGRVLSANPEACRMFGMTLTEFCQSGRSGIIDPDDQRFIAALESRELNGEFSGELNFARKDGEVFPADVSSSTFSDSSGIIMAAVRIRDISERKRLEQALLDSEERYHVLFNEVQIGICMADADSGIILDCNQAMADLTGRPIVNLVGSHQTSLHPSPECNNRFSATFVQHRNVLAGTVLRDQLITASGEIREVEIKCRTFAFRGKLVLLGTFIDITERRQAEQALNETRERFMKLLDTVPTVAVQGYELDGTVIYWNKASETLYGYPSEEALGANLLKLIIPPAMREGVMHAIQHMKETDIPVPAGELSLLRKGGSLVPVHSSHALIQTGGSEPVLFCLDIDMSERKRMEEKLQHASDEWRRTFDTIPDMITILDSEHRIVRANRATWQKLGCEKRDLLGKPCYTLFHGLDSPPDFCPHAQLMLNGLSHSIETFELNLNSYLDVTVTPLCDTDGKMYGSIHVARDITEKKLAGEALRESEVLYRSILTASPDNITITDLKGSIRMVSPKGLAMFGYERDEELLGRSIIEFIAPEDRERANANITLMFQGTFTGPGEYRAIRTDGSPIMVEANCDFVSGSDGQAENMIFVIRDISERKRVEAELNRMNSEIEQFIYTVSHDLRSPLVTVKTFLGYLGQDISSGNSERTAKDMEFIHTATDRMEALLNELLNLSRTGWAINSHEFVTFQEIIAEILDTFAGQIRMGKVDIQVTAADPRLCGDRRRLLQIWQNLLENALKYMGDQAEPRIEIGVEQVQGETVFFVCDNGIGIAPIYHEKIFGIFEQLNRNAGVGMGLTMVKRIVEMYGGHIRVESDGDCSGSCFRFTLPVAYIGNNGE